MLEILLNPARLRSRGPFLDPPLLMENKIIVGPGVWLTPNFVMNNNITHVLNVSVLEATPGWVRNSFKNRFHFIPCDDTLEFDIFAKYPEFESKLKSYMQDPICGRIYVHCQAGMNRSATLAVAFTVKYYKRPLEYIVRNSLHQRPCILMNTAFNEKLEEFAKKQV